MSRTLTPQLGNVITLNSLFTEKYTATIVTAIVAGNMLINTKSGLRWQFSVVEVLGTEAVVELITLDNQLFESNNPMVKDMAAMSQAFSRMYSELLLKINAGGQVLQVLNLNQVKAKWGQLKQEMEAIQENNPAVSNVIAINEQLFTAPDKMLQSIQNNEFFQLYFHHYFNVSLPGTTAAYPQRTLLNTATIDWQYRATITNGLYSDASLLNVQIEGLVNTYTGGDWKKKAYQDFSHLHLADLKQYFEEQGTYRIEKTTGKLLESTLVKKEIVHPTLLHATISYKMMSDTLAEMEEKR